MSFLLKLCSYVTSKLSETDERIVKDRLCLDTLFALQIFTEIINRNENFGEFGQIESFHVKIQDYFLALLWKAIENNLFNFSLALTACHPGIIAEAIRFYIMKIDLFFI